MKYKNNKTVTTVLLTIVLLVIILFLLIKTGKEPVKNMEVPLGEDLIITSIGSYRGAYLEDGSDEKVNDVLMITVKNNGTKMLQYAEATLKIEDTAAEFAFSTLRPGESMVILEKNRKEYIENMNIDSVELHNVIFFDVAPTFCEDKLKISAMDGAFNVENISGDDLAGNIAIYYKNKQDDLYYGGITYRAVIEGGIEKDGIKQIMTNHFTLKGSEVMFVGYTEME